MKKVIALGLLLVALSPMGVGALTVNSTSNTGWTTVSGQVSFADANDKLVIEFNGLEIIKLEPYCGQDWRVGLYPSLCQTRFISTLDGNGGWMTSQTIQDKDFSFDLNRDAGEFKMFLISNGNKTQIW